MLRVLEGQTRVHFFLDSILDPHVNQCIVPLVGALVGAVVGALGAGALLRGHHHGHQPPRPLCRSTKP